MFLNLEEFDDVEYASDVKCDDEKWTIIDRGDWISTGKYVHQTCIVIPQRVPRLKKLSLSTKTLRRIILNILLTSIKTVWMKKFIKLYMLTKWRFQIDLCRWQIYSLEPS